MVCDKQSAMVSDVFFSLVEDGLLTHVRIPGVLFHTTINEDACSVLMAKGQWQQREWHEVVYTTV